MSSRHWEVGSEAGAQEKQTEDQPCGVEWIDSNAKDTPMNILLAAKQELLARHQLAAS